MGILKKAWIRSGLRYLAIASAIALAIYIYSGETDPPKMELFSTSASTVDLTTGTSYSFSGVISDARGIASATLECASGEGVEFVIVVATTGINKYRVSFGRTSSSPTWVGRWEGNRQRIQFEGLGEVPADTPDLTCDWFAHLKDSLGNEITTPMDVVMTVRS